MKPHEWVPRWAAVFSLLICLLVPRVALCQGRVDCNGNGFPDELEVDTDTDGIIDDCDLCREVFNPEQVDTDGDDIGNACDCDFNQDGFCGGPDFTLFIGCFNAPTGGNPTCEAADMTGDGFVGGPDFTLFIGGFNGPPGPSGL